MKIVIFAGGVGTRLWPLSRKNTPKQFGKIIGDQSTLQQTIARLQPEYKNEDIYIATGERYKDVITSQLPFIPQENFIFEPDMRDVGPAIGLVASVLEKNFPDDPVAILWSDHIVKNIDAFKEALLTAENEVHNKKSPFVFMAQKPRFANQNMGWIQVGREKEKTNNVTVYEFEKFCYRPSLEQAEDFFANQSYVWNLGYFVTTPRFLFNLYKTYAEEMYASLIGLRDKWGTADFNSNLKEIYPKLEKISFDDLILMKMNKDSLLVVSADLGWSDVGAWESLKEALSETKDDNVTKGTVVIEDSRDSLVYNYKEQLIVGIDLNEMLVINTQDVLLICPKTSVPKIKKFVEKLAGTEHEHLI